MSEPYVYTFDPEVDPGPEDAGRDAPGPSENTEVEDAADAGCECPEHEGDA